MYGRLLRGIIFSFHMPLFFILSSFTFHYSENTEQFVKKSKNAAKHLLIPAVLTFFLNVMICIAHDFVLLFDSEYWMETLYSFIFASGVKILFDDYFIPGIGIAWFLFALFLGRTIYDWIQLSFDKRQTPIIVFLFSIAGVILGSSNIWLPFSGDIALAILPFFLFGDKLKNLNLEACKLGLPSSLVYIVTLFITFPDYRNYTYLELAIRRYFMYPINYICVIAGTMTIIYCCYHLCHFKKLCTPLIYIGKNSLYLLCVHIMDDLWRNWWFVEGFHVQTAIRRIFFDLIIFLVIMLIRDVYSFLRNVHSPHSE